MSRSHMYSVGETTLYIVTLGSGYCRFPPVIHRHGSISNIVPVSYTHLDVYKRQAQVAQIPLVHDVEEGGKLVAVLVIAEMCIRDRRYPYAACGGEKTYIDRKN